MGKAAIVTEAAGTTGGGVWYIKNIGVIMQFSSNQREAYS
jgi:hypothetical protein